MNRLLVHEVQGFSKLLVRMHEDIWIFMSVGMRCVNDVLYYKKRILNLNERNINWI